MIFSIVFNLIGPKVDILRCASSCEFSFPDFFQETSSLYLSEIGISLVMVVEFMAERFLP